MDSTDAEPPDAETITYLYEHMDPKLPGAIGAFMLNWNACEAVLTNLLSHFMGQHVYGAVKALSNQARVTLLVSYITNGAATPQVAASISNFISRYNIITETRNVVVHGMVFPSGMGMLLVKRTGERVVNYEISADLMESHARVALELFHSGANILAHLQESPPGKPIALPSKFPKASKLVPRPRPEANTSKSPPQS